jgi:translocator protein
MSSQPVLPKKGRGTKASPSLKGTTSPTKDTTSKSSYPLTTLNIVNFLAFGFNLAITYTVGVAGWLLTLKTNAELSEKYQTLVTPVNWAFAIWGIIFLAQGIWVVVPVILQSQRNHPLLIEVGYDYLFVCLAQAGWTFCFAFEFLGLSLVFMLLILSFLVRIVLTLHHDTVKKGERQQQQQQQQQLPGGVCSRLGTYLLWQFPFTIHCGWIIAASVVNANVVLFALVPNADILQFIAALISLLGLLGVAAVSIRYFDVLVIPLVIAWALGGVFAELSNPKESIDDLFSDTQIQVSQFGAGGIGLMVVALVILNALRLAVAWCRSPNPKSGAATTTTSTRRPAGTSTFDAPTTTMDDAAHGYVQI